MQPADDRPRREQPGMRPIGYNVWVSEGSARPGYTYTLDGQEYTADEAAEVVRPFNEARWTWRPVGDAATPDEQGSPKATPT